MAINPLILVETTFILVSRKLNATRKKERKGNKPMAKLEQCNCPQAKAYRRALKEAYTLISKMICGGTSITSLMEMQHKINRLMEGHNDD